MIERKFSAPNGKLDIGQVTDILDTIFQAKTRYTGFHHPGNFFDDEHGQADRTTTIYPVVLSGASLTVTLRDGEVGIKVHGEQSYEDLFQKNEGRLADYFASLNGNGQHD